MVKVYPTRIMKMRKTMLIQKNVKFFFILDGSIGLEKTKKKYLLHKFFIKTLNGVNFSFDFLEVIILAIALKGLCDGEPDDKTGPTTVCIFHLFKEFNNSIFKQTNTLQGI